MSLLIFQPCSNMCALLFQGRTSGSGYLGSLVDLKRPGRHYWQISQLTWIYKHSSSVILKLLGSELLIRKETVIRVCIIDTIMKQWIIEKKLYEQLAKKPWLNRDSNLRHLDCRTSALPSDIYGSNGYSFWLAPPFRQRLVDYSGGPPSNGWIAQIEEH